MGGTTKNNAPNTLKIHLKRFKPSSIKTNRVCVAVGKKGTGKSTVIQELMWFQQNIPVGIIMSATEEANEAYSKMVPPLFLYKEFDAEALQRIVNRQKKMKSMYKQNGDQLPFDHRAFVLIDDCMYDKKNFRLPLIRELFMNGRHWDLFVLITMQYIMDLTVEIRANTDYVFALKENIRKNRERLYNEFFGVFPSFAVFDALFLDVTQNYRCLVLDNTVPSTEIEDVVFWYKAAERPPFRVGSEWFWQYGDTHTTNGNGLSQKEMAAQLQQMNQKAVKVVYEDQRPPPTTKISYTNTNPPMKRKDPYGRTAPPPPDYKTESLRSYTNRYNDYEQPVRDFTAYKKYDQPKPPPQKNRYDETPFTTAMSNIVPQRAAYSLELSNKNTNLYTSYTENTNHNSFWNL